MSQKTQECVRCVQTANWPGITFDKHGVCSYCSLYDQVWSKTGPHREPEFRAIVERAKAKHRPYDAVVGVSGGKDSCYALHVMVKEYGAKVLACTIDNGWISDTARDNIARVVKGLGVEHRYLTFGADLVKKVNTALFKNRCGDLCQVCVGGIIARVSETLVQERVPLLVMGTAPRSEPVPLPPGMHCVGDYHYLKSSTAPYVPTRELRAFRGMDLPYLAYTLLWKRIKFVMMGEYRDWNPDHIIKTLAQYGFIEKRPGKAHWDCVLNPAVVYFWQQRLGTTPLVEKVALQVRSGEITREEGLKQRAEALDVPYPEETLKIIKERLDVSDEDIQAFVNGQAHSYEHFSSYTRYLYHLRFAMLFFNKLGLMTPLAYMKYSK